MARNCSSYSIVLILRTFVWVFKIIMKKILVILSMLFAAPSFACIICDTHCRSTLNIQVKNNTGENCSLLDIIVRSGQICPFYTSQSKKFIQMTNIAPGESGSLLLDSSKFDGVNVVLSYQCGDSKFTTFNSAKSYWNILSALPTSLSGMNADFELQDSSCSLLMATEDLRPATVAWTLY
jgi:hypothetical protein